MSTRTNVSGSHTDNLSREKESLTVMLERYLQSPPTVTERLAVPWLCQATKDRPTTTSPQDLKLGNGSQSRL
ncbi:hypothetical protein VTK26DRAFT_8127 [Humicola hyalothermophila]